MGKIIVRFSRCLYCGRGTPHEVCHAHSEAVHPGWWDALEAATPVPEDILLNLWAVGFDQEPETCTDKACPVWEPGSWDLVYGTAQEADGA